MPIVLILRVFAFVLFAISASVYNPQPPAPSPWGWGRFVAAGLAFWVLSEIVTGFNLH